MWPFPSQRSSRLRRRLTLADSFRRRLEVDRLRADRMGISIAVIAIGWDERGSWDGRPDPDCVRAEVADLIEDHLRATDEAGGLGDDQIGVVLWNTDRTGAEIFITRLLEAAPKRLKIAPEAYLYPMPDDAACGIEDAAEPQGNVPAGGSDDGEDVEDDESQSDDGAQANDPAEEAADESFGDAAEPAREPVLARSGVPMRPLAPALARSLSPMQRLVDIVGSGVGLVLASPLLLAAAAAIKLEDRGPVFFSQQRS